MAHEIVMPQLNLSMDKGRIVNWLKQTGDKINAGDVLLEIESDKAIVEVEAVGSGILQTILGPESGEIPVGSVIAYLRGENETLQVQPSPIQPVMPVYPAGPGIVNSSSISGSRPTGRRLPSSPSARRKAAELNVDWQKAAGTGRGGRIKERDVLRLAQEIEQASSHPTAPSFSIQLTPLAKRVADHFGLENRLLAELLPGKIHFEREDVEEVLRQVVRERQSSPPLTSPGHTLPVRTRKAPYREVMGVVRKRIAERMMLSMHTYAPVTLTTEIDATELVRLRETINSDPRLVGALSYNALFVKIAALSLSEYPVLNASIDGEETVYWPTVNIGVAVDTGRGLVVPVIRDVVEKPISDLSREMSELLDRAAQGKATVDELRDGTFTITNLGAYDIDIFTPIINPPECAVLGIGRLRKQLVIVNDQPAMRTMLTLCLTFDHRLVDGAPAARFLQRIKQLCEQPDLWLKWPNNQISNTIRQ